MRTAPLTVIKGGINRQRVRGGARADNLYDLLNGYVTDAGTVVARDGCFRDNTLDELTRGLVYFDGSRHTFCHEVVAVPDGYTLHVLHHPDASADYPIELEKIHFAAPMMGALYVTAEFADGEIYDYWLQSADAWEADTIYTHGALVSPTVPNGIVYQASRLGDPYPAWAPNVPRYDGTGDYEVSIIEPTVYNDFYYTCIEALGTNPRSGTVEPEWPTEDGAQIAEETDGVVTAEPAPPTPPSTQTPGSSTEDRYANRGGSRAGGGR